MRATFRRKKEWRLLKGIDIAQMHAPQYRKGGSQVQMRLPKEMYSGLSFGGGEKAMQA
jgi:hypothetical protein